MSITPEHGTTGRPVTDADLLAALLPDTPAAAVRPPSPKPVPAAVPTVAELLEAARLQGALTPAPRPADPTPAPAGPVVPRWAVGTAVASVGVGTGAVLLAAAADLLGSAAAALAAGLATLAGPLLVAAGVLLAVVLIVRSGRRDGGVEVTQTITQTITQHVRTGR